MLNPHPNSNREVDSLTSVEQCFVIPELMRLLNFDDIKLSLQPFGPFMPLCAPPSIESLCLGLVV